MKGSLSAVFLLSRASPSWELLPALLLLIPLVYAIRRRTESAPGEQTTSSAPHRDPDRDDDRSWVAGVFYVNSKNPALLVKKRYGFGRTLNFGHPISWLFLALALSIPFLVKFLAVRH